jgi:hypothetical protein
LWTGLQFTTPFLITGAWIVNRQREGGMTRDDDAFVPETMARVIGAIGVLAMAMSLFLSLSPQATIDRWPRM